MRSARGPLAMCCAVLYAAPLAAQESTPQQDQFWPEIDYYQSFTAHTRLFTTAQWTLDGLPGQQTEQYGVAFDFMYRRRFILSTPLGAAALEDDRREWAQLRVGYRYAHTIETTTPTVTNRLFTELTLRANVASLLIADRNGFDWRWVGGVYSTRYRNRVEAQRSITVGTYKLSPYSNCEWAYVLAQSGWNSVKCEIGAQFPVLPRFTVIPYYGIVNTWQSSPVNTQAFGFTLVASF